MIDEEKQSLKKKRGGAGRGQGAKPLKQGEKSVVITFRVIQSQRDKLKQLGGGKWLRGCIDRARVK